MKFSQFLELDETLNQEGHTIDEFKSAMNNPDDEMILEFFGINKALMSWGIKGWMKGRLDNQIKKFTVETGNAIQEAIKQLVSSKKKVQDAGPLTPETRAQISAIELEIIKMVNSTVDKLAKLKTEEIETRIDRSKRLKDSAKIALRYFWEKSMIESKAILLTLLMKQKIIEDEVNIKKLDGFLKGEESKVKTKAKEVNKEVKQKKEEEESQSETKEKSAGEKVGSEL